MNWRSEGGGVPFEPPSKQLNQLVGVNGSQITTVLKLVHRHSDAVKSPKALSDLIVLVIVFLQAHLAADSLLT